MLACSKSHLEKLGLALLLASGLLIEACDGGASVDGGTPEPDAGTFSMNQDAGHEDGGDPEDAGADSGPVWIDP